MLEDARESNQENDAEHMKRSCKLFQCLQSSLPCLIPVDRDESLVTITVISFPLNAKNSST